MSNFSENLNPFGQKEEIILSEFEKEGIYTLVTKFPELWEPVKKLIYSKMNFHARKLVTAPTEDVVKLQSRVAELDSIVADILEIKKSYIKTSKLTPVTTQPVSLSKENTPTEVQSEDKSTIMDYIMSKDVRGKDGKVRLSA